MRIYLEDDDGHVLKIKFQTPAKHIVGGLPRPEFVLSLRIVACDDIFPWQQRPVQKREESEPSKAKRSLQHGYQLTYIIIPTSH